MKHSPSRSVFDRTKRYVGVLMQQGSVIVDSDWNEWQEVDVGIALVEMWAILADQLTYYQDQIADEAFLSTASRRLRVSKVVLRSVFRMAQAVNANTSEIATRKLKRAKASGTQRTAV